MKKDLLDTVGAIEIAARAREEFGTELNLRTIRGWETRRAAWVAEGRPHRSEKRPRDEAMPDPVGEVNGSPAWSWADVRPWLVRSGKVNDGAQ